MRTRLNKDDRKQAILAAACGVAKRIGYRHITRRLVALEARCSAGLVSWYYPSVESLKQAVIEQAMLEGDASILLQGMLHKEPLLLAMPQSDKESLVQTVCDDYLG